MKLPGFPVSFHLVNADLWVVPQALIAIGNTPLRSPKIRQKKGTAFPKHPQPATGQKAQQEIWKPTLCQRGPTFFDASNEVVYTSGGWLQAKERKRNLRSLKITLELPLGWSTASVQGKEAEMKRLPACGSTEGLANLSLTQPLAIQRGHSTALLP